MCAVDCGREREAWGGWEGEGREEETEKERGEEREKERRQEERREKERRQEERRGERRGKEMGEERERKKLFTSFRGKLNQNIYINVTIFRGDFQSVDFVIKKGNNRQVYIYDYVRMIFPSTYQVSAGE